ncbi:MAG: aminotransferase class I/II-fold pyridoxal phosphate-dependent enzyme, partial [Nitrospira sp.]|nr:aminotransferase class I/II-fold pyridoxal phosphate-dependent enzyme [Nitrospira sp.]
LGCWVAFIVVPREIIQFLINRARPFIFTTAPPPGPAAAAQAALTVIQQEPHRRARLWENRERLFRGLQRLGFRMTETVSPILPVLIGDANTALAFSAHLLVNDVYAPPVRPPTVPRETSRVRVTVTSEHTAAHIDQALQAFESAGRALRLI